MISFSQALEAIRNEVQRKTPVELPVAETLGLVCAAEYSAPEPQPMFANSAMDGFALKSHEATELSTKFKVIGSSAAGDAPPPTCSRSASLNRGLGNHDGRTAARDI